MSQSNLIAKDKETEYRVAPPGFSPQQREEFDRTGVLNIEGAIAQDDIEMYLDAIDRCIARDPNADLTKFYSKEHIVERDPVFTDLIDHPRHVGFAYDFYGELLKLHISQFFSRPKGGNHNLWHPDGARALPYGVFAPELPLQIKFGYWLTDLPRAGMGNMVLRPGSQRDQYFDRYDTHDSVPDEMILTVPRGTLTIMNCNVWHRVEPNESEQKRQNIFVAYCPSWIVAADHLRSDPAWLATLNREQRIIMRDYDYAYDHTKPKPSEFPLFLDRETKSDHDAGKYHERVTLERRKRLVAHEKMAA